jgi:hypothetical protein
MNSMRGSTAAWRGACAAPIDFGTYRRAAASAFGRLATMAARVLSPRTSLLCI